MSESFEMVVARMEERANSRASDRWQDILDVWLILHVLPQRSPLRKERVSEITGRTRYKSATVGQMERVANTCFNPATGELELPLRLDWSTALLMAQKGATLEDMRLANDESWTRTQARAWAIDRVRVPAEGKPVTLWRWLTKHIPAEDRKVTSPDGLDRGGFLAAVRAALDSFGRE